MLRHKLLLQLGTVLFFIACFFTIPKAAFAATFTSSASGNWNVGTTWGGACASSCVAGTDYPGSGDTATITSTNNVTVTANASVSAVTFGTGSTAGVVKVNSGITLTVSGAVTLLGTTGSSTAGTVQDGTGAGTITAGSVSVGTSGSTAGSNSLTTTFTSTISNFTISGAVTTNCMTSGGGQKKNQTILNLSSGTMSVGGTITVCGTGTGALFQMNQGSQNATLTTSASTPWSITAPGTATLSGTSATVEYSGASQPILVQTYTNLTLDGSGTATGAVTTVNGNFTMSGTVSYTTGANLVIGGNLSIGTSNTFTTGATFDLTVTGTTSVSGTLALSGSGSPTFADRLTFNNNASLTTGSGQIGFRQGLTNNNGSTIDFGSAAVLFESTVGSQQTITGNSSITFGGIVQIQGPSVGTYEVVNNNTATVTLNGGLDGFTTAATVKWTQGTNSDTVYNSTTNIYSTDSAGTLDASTNTPNTFEYNAAGAQSIFDPNAGTAHTYYNLKLGGTGNDWRKQASAGMTVNGDFTIGGRAFFDAGTSLTHTLKGNLIVTTVSSLPMVYTTSSTINFNTPGTPAATSISGTPLNPIEFDTVNVNNTSGFTIGANTSMDTSMTIASGVITTVASNVTLTPALFTALISGSGTLTGSGIIRVTRIAATADMLSQYTVTTLDLSNLEVDYVGTSAQTVDATTYGSNLKVMPFTNGVTHTFAGGTVSVGGNLTLGDGSHTSAAVTAGANSTTLTVTGDVTIAASTTFTANGSNNTTVGGNWTNNGTFTHNSGTVVFNTSSPSTITGATTFNNFTSTTAGKTIKFQKKTGSSPVFTFAGTFTLTGGSGNNIQLSSDTGGTQWLAHFNSAQPSGNVTNTTVTDSGCDSGSSTVTLDGTNTNGNGNDSACWLFAGAAEQTIQGGTNFKGGVTFQ